MLELTRFRKEFDRQLAKADCLLPLRRCETAYLAQVRRQGAPRRVSVVLTLHIVLAIVLHLLDLGLWLVLQAIRDHAQLQAYDSRLQRNASLYDIEGRGHDEHLRSFMAAAGAGAGAGLGTAEANCMPEPRLPSVEGLAFTVLIYALLMLAVVLRSPLFDRSTLLIGHFYPERQIQRACVLHTRLVHRRARLTQLIVTLVRRRQREIEAERLFTLSASSATTSSSCWRTCQYAMPHCLACLTPREASLVYCDTDRCEGVYCADCFSDLGQRCPLCANYDEATHT